MTFVTDHDMAQPYHDPPQDGAATSDDILLTTDHTVNPLAETPQQQLFSASVQLALDLETTYEESIAYTSAHTQIHDDVMIWLIRPALFGSQHLFGYDYIYEERLRTAESLEPEPPNPDYIDRTRVWRPEDSPPYEHSDMGNAQSRFSCDLYELSGAQDSLDERLWDMESHSRTMRLHVAAMEHAIRMDGIMVLRGNLVYWQKQGGAFAAGEMKRLNDGRPGIGEFYLRFVATLAQPLDLKEEAGEMVDEDLLAAEMSGRLTERLRGTQ